MAVAGRSISMFSLITDGILEPGEELLTFDYLGRRHSATLLPEGTIQWNGQIFASPYAWASHCKNLINPHQKTAIGWGHIRYNGIKLSQYKNIYLKKHNRLSTASPTKIQDSGLVLGQPAKRGRRRKAAPVEQPKGYDDYPTDDTLLHQAGIGKEVGDKAPSKQSAEVTHQAALSLTSELIECLTFEAIRQEQPYSVEVSSNVLLLMDFHAHLCWSEVTGYLGGRFDPSSNALQILQAFPCRCNTASEEEGMVAEKEIQEKLKTEGLQVVGWYHSHPSNEATPSHKDITQQLEYQEKIKLAGSEIPCVALIVGPNLANKKTQIQSSMTAYCVCRRGEQHASPILVQYSISWEHYLTQAVVDEMNRLATYYRQRPDFVNLKTLWREGIPFVHKLKTSLAAVQPKFPLENSDQTFFTFIEQLAFQVQ